MLKKTAEIITYLFNPLILPLAGVFIILNSGLYDLAIPEKGKWLIYLIIFTSTFLLPLSILPFFYYLKLIDSFMINEKRARILPLIITFIIYYITFLIFYHKIPLHFVVTEFIHGTAFAVFFIIIISFFWKISIHLVGFGGLLALLLFISFSYKVDLMYLIMIVLFISGLTAAARLYLQHHNLIQIYMGFILGFITITGFLVF
jgi:hypothetical protein